ncbi:MAG: heparinase II/III family protein [Candidatus Hydrogenedentes bacterium]|nr:heparinase II/III family protein [Candidatus Hydrogenedentota bacterium]
MLRMVFVCLLPCLAAVSQGPVKTGSVFYSTEILARARANAEAHDWARAIRDDVVKRAEPWMGFSDDALWDMMMGPNIPRTWHVWSDGYCPSCKADVRMYEWVADPFAHPWKLKCPKCSELFPKNDFEKYHRSGFDEHGVFQPGLADKALLFNAEHPDPADPLHTFGVEDGDGYVADEHRWRFIGYYVIFGHWKKLVHEGIVSLSAAYAVTGDPRYAHKAALLLDRVADLYPSFDFHTQGGWVYETTNGTRGQVSTWHDACEEVRALAYAYDRVFDGAKAQEAELVALLSRKAGEHKLANAKTSWADIQRNIESGIFEDTLAHRERIESNYPRTDMTNLVIHAVLRWPENREEVMQQLDAIIDKSTAVDGMSGEKGIGGYSSVAPSALAEILIQMSRLEPDFLKTTIARKPKVVDAFRFYIDIWCMEEWYPRIGDANAFGKKSAAYGSTVMTPNTGAEGSVYSFLWDLYRITDDPAFSPAFLQVIFLENRKTVEGLPHDLFAENPAAIQAGVQNVIDTHGAEINTASVNKEIWRVALLRAGTGENRRALWIDYDSGGGHGHWDGMNIGLFAKGLDLIPDFGYPPVGYGGWGAPRATWYMKTASHATVVVDGQNQKAAQGTTGLWADGKDFHAIRVSSPEMIGGETYERTLAMVDLDGRDSYIVDVFRVKGGGDHAKFFGSFFGTIETNGLTLADGVDFDGNTQMRAFKTDADAKPGWSVAWTLEDKYDYIADNRKVYLNYTDFTTDAEASVCEAWVDTGIYGGEETEWIPRVMVRRKTTAAPLESTFVSVIEPHDGVSKIKGMRRVDVELNGSAAPDSVVGIEIDRADGDTDVLLFNSAGGAPIAMPERSIVLNGELLCVTFGSDREARARGVNTRKVTIGDSTIAMRDMQYFDEAVSTVNTEQLKSIAGG